MSQKYRFWMLVRSENSKSCKKGRIDTQEEPVENIKLTLNMLNTYYTINILQNIIFIGIKSLID